MKALAWQPADHSSILQHQIGFPKHHKEPLLRELGTISKLQGYDSPRTPPKKEKIYIGDLDRDIKHSTVYIIYLDFCEILQLCLEDRVVMNML